MEKETHHNIEVRWLIHELHPDHNTISNFRRDNPEAIRKVFHQTVTVAKHHNLIGGRLINILGKEVIKPFFRLLLSCFELILNPKSHIQPEKLIFQQLHVSCNLIHYQQNPVSY